MPDTSQPSRTAHLWHTLAAVFFAGLLAGCANGDFGEVRPTLVNDHIHDWLGPVAADHPFKPSFYQLTDDERSLRDFAYPLIEPPYDRQQWYSVAGEWGLMGTGKEFDRAAYSDRLLGDYTRSASTRYARLIDDVRNDETRLSQFFETATRVLDMDDKRRKSMAVVRDLNKGERANALRRMRENYAIVTLVSRKLGERVAGYRYALGRLVVADPSPQAADVEVALNRLSERIHNYRSRPAPSWVRERSLAANN